MKIDEKHVLIGDSKYEGGEEGEVVEQPPAKKSRKDHYNEKYPGYKTTDSGLNHETGLNFNRTCTDFLCLVLFLAFLAGMASIAMYSLIKGNPKTLYKPYDFQERICGFSPGVEDYGKLYMTRLQLTFQDGANMAQGKNAAVIRSLMFEEAVCVKKCPGASKQVECPPDEQSQKKCNDGKDGIYETYSFLDVCVPVVDKLDANTRQEWGYIFQRVEENPVIQEIQGLMDSWKAITFSIFTALAISIIYIYLLSLFAEYLAWALIFVVQIGFVVMAGIGFYTYVSAAAANKQDKSRVGLVFGIVFSIVALLFALAVYCGWNKLKIAIEIIDVSADFLAGTKRLMAVPFMYYLILITFFLFWLASVFSVYSLATITPDPQDGSNYIPLEKKIDWLDKGVGKTANIFLAVLVFGLVWVTFFLSYSNNYVTLVTASTFYFDSSRENWGSGNVSLALKWAWVHNIGSLAFGSLIIAIMFVVRMIVYYACKKAEKAAGENPVVKIALCLAQCILKCIEEIMEYINKAAYAFMAVSGESFCQSALHGLILQLNHGAEFAFANFLAAMFMLLGKIGLTVLNTVLTYVYIQKTTPIGETPSLGLPLTIVFLTTYMLVSVFIGMFDEAVFGMLTCLSADLDLHNGDNKFGPKSLHELIDSINGVEGSEKDLKETNEIQ